MGEQLDALLHIRCVMATMGIRLKEEELEY